MGQHCCCPDEDTIELCGHDIPLTLYLSPYLEACASGAVVTLTYMGVLAAPPGSIYATGHQWQGLGAVGTCCDDDVEFILLSPPPGDPDEGCGYELFLRNGFFYCHSNVAPPVSFSPFEHLASVSNSTVDPSPPLLNCGPRITCNNWADIQVLG